MFEQDVTAASVDESAPRKSKPSNWIAAAAVGVVALLAVVGWFAFLSPHDSTVSLSADASQAAPGVPVPVSGRVTPAAPNRVVEVAVASTQAGPFTSAGTAITDAAGRFAMKWSPSEPGPVWVMARAVALGRDQQASSDPVTVTVRAPSSLTLKAAAPSVRTTGSTVVTATLAPAGATVTFEKSSDGQNWTPLDADSAATSGTATAKITGLAGGLWHIRATAAQTDAATRASAREVTVLVEDYKAAGEKYLAIVADGNKAITKLNSMIDSGASQAALKKQAAKISDVLTSQAKEFSAYKGWPREVAPVVADLAKQTVVDADNYNMRSQSRSVSEWNEIADQGNAAGVRGGNDAARIRDMLGLPKRDLHP